ncbi:Na(+)/H(+) antiporter subunit C [Micrococcus sp.]|uniref:Na(+)/H(+) antiporter subunit C n=1 Tax=Micrococcus sp. TaxID=1271 RepID=UPI002A91CC59|nr:Na(+)/H(+) antiporter subunit C [Micrococcus sp.]MDY6054893.1 Na(+)/H(+) antiporter subunit C [Micrococcus sp.]
MTVDLALLTGMGVLYAGGVYLVMERNLTRIMLGLMLITNATILLLFVTAGGGGRPPIREAGVDGTEYADPLPQALMLTAIVIGFAVTAFLAAMIYRSWLLRRLDEIREDAEDRRVASQSTWDAEDDAELIEEHSEFMDDDADPNAHYEQTSAEAPKAKRAGRPSAPAEPHSMPRAADGGEPA